MSPRNINYPIRLWNAQEGRCFHCRKPILKTPAKKAFASGYDKGWTREHVVPRKLGGKDGGNIVLSCLSCNSRRGHEAPGAGMIQRCKAIQRAAGLA